MAAAAVLAVCACLSLAMRPKPRTVERIVYVDSHAPTQTVASPAAGAHTGVPYIEMRQAMADRSMDATEWGNGRAADDLSVRKPRTHSLFFGLIKYASPDSEESQ